MVCVDDVARLKGITDSRPKNAMLRYCRYELEVWKRGRPWIERVAVMVSHTNEVHMCIFGKKTLTEKQLDEITEFIEAFRAKRRDLKFKRKNLTKKGVREDCWSVTQKQKGN